MSFLCHWLGWLQPGPLRLPSTAGHPCATRGIGAAPSTGSVPALRPCRRGTAAGWPQRGVFSARSLACTADVRDTQGDKTFWRQWEIHRPDAAHEERGETGSCERKEKKRLSGKHRQLWRSDPALQRHLSTGEPRMSSAGMRCSSFKHPRGILNNSPRAWQRGGTPRGIEPAAGLPCPGPPCRPSPPPGPRHGGRLPARLSVLPSAWQALAYRPLFSSQLAFGVYSWLR